MTAVLRVVFAILLVAVMLLGPRVAAAQDYPNRIVRLVVTYGPGSVTDIVARVIAPDMAKLLGQPVIVENKPGADTVIGFDHVARQSPPDGYTVVVSIVPGLASLPLVASDLRFDPLKDLPPVIDLTDSRLVFGSSTQFPWKTLPELVAAAKSNPGKLNYGVASSLTKMMMDGLVRDLGIQAVAVQFTGGGPWNMALGQGTVEMGFIAEGAAVGLGNKLRALAVTGEQRSTHYPATPTFRELGYPDYNGLVISLNVRAGTAKQATDKLNSVTTQVMKNIDVRKRLQSAGFDIISDSSQENAARRLADQARFFAQIAKAGVASK